MQYLFYKKMPDKLLKVNKINLTKLILKQFVPFLKSLI
jgi:hypothetical protein